ncbi:MBL fold metallo-hydrolase [Candidatus Roizmanbacteria bacterium]|nr:MBL fold metallo-hydrolase [Candidatus Roizmanbacteria bacterium]
MEKPPVTLKVLLTFSVLSLVFIGVSYVSSFSDNSTRVVFCDVGQGDGTYIRVENKIDIVIDAGSDKKILNCLAEHMPFYDRKIEIAFMTHPDYDHYGGFLHIFDRYSVERVITVPLEVKKSSYLKLQGKIKKRGTLVQNLYAGDSINFSKSSIRFLWPEAGYVLENANKNLPTNSFSQVFIYSEGAFDILFTGDYELDYRIKNKLNVDIEILKVPHHGSKDGLNSEILTVSKPEVAVISVGKGNSYGHPHQSILDLLEASKIEILRTDEKGDIKFKLSK